MINEAGEKTAVIIPIQEWEQILAWYQQSAKYQELKNGLKDAFAEVKAIEAGERPKRSLDGLLEETKPNVLEAVTEIKPAKPLEEIVKEQNYKPISYQEFRALADKVQMEEPIEDLLAMLTK